MGIGASEEIRTPQDRGGTWGVRQEERRGMRTTGKTKIKWGSPDGRNFWKPNYICHGLLRADIPR